jgi:hypothetical protein
MKHTFFSTAITAAIALLPCALGAQKLLVNADFSSALGDWTAGSNLYNSTGLWTSYTTLSGSAIVADSSAHTATLGVATSSSATSTETVLFQDIDKKYFQTGDVIHFKGSYSVAIATNGSGSITPRLFIDGMDTWDAIKSWSTIVTPSFAGTAGKTTSGTFEFSAMLGENASLNIVRIGASLYLNDAKDKATLTIGNLDAWINDDDSSLVGAKTEGYWAGFPIDPSGYVDTGDWLGWIYPVGDWAWSCNLTRWIYLPEYSVRDAGSWVYVMGQ